MTLKLDTPQKINGMANQLRKLGATIRGVEFMAHKRPDGNTNRQILEYLLDQGRDFISMNKEQMAGCQRAFSQVLSRRLPSVRATNPKQYVTAINKVLEDALRASILYMISVIRQRILDGVDANGNPVKDLTEQYAKYKVLKYGHKDPIGFLSGQLLKNLEPSNKNVKTIK